MPQNRRRRRRYKGGARGTCQGVQGFEPVAGDLVVGGEVCEGEDVVWREKIDFVLGKGGHAASRGTALATARGGSQEKMEVLPEPDRLLPVRGEEDVGSPPTLPNESREDVGLRGSGES